MEVEGGGGLGVRQVHAKEKSRPPEKGSQWVIYFLKAIPVKVADVQRACFSTSAVISSPVRKATSTASDCVYGGDMVVRGRSFVSFVRS